MGYVNRKDRGFRTQAHANWMGGPAYFLADPFQTLRLALAACFFGEPQYYHRDTQDPRPLRHQSAERLTDGDVAYLREVLHAVDPQEWRAQTPAEMVERAIDAALVVDPERTLQEAARLRHEDYIRVTPQVMLVRAANGPARGTGLVRRYAPDIIARADEPAVGLAYHIARYGRAGQPGRPVPNSLKRAWRDALGRFDEYDLAKYRLAGREVNTVDVARLVHATGPAVDRLLHDELRLTGQTWEAIISQQGSTPEAWRAAVARMPHMALLRNLRNLVQHGVAPAEFVDRLVAGARTGKQLPFRYYSAYRALLAAKAPGPVLDAVEQCLRVALGNLPTFRGRVMALCDNSGSTRHTCTSALGSMEIAAIANLTGVLVGMRADEGYVGLFGDRLETMPVRQQASVFAQVDQAETLGQRVGGSTENGIWLFWDQAIRQREHWDMVFVLSDMQAGHGGLYGCAAHDYRDYIWTPRGGNYIDVPKLIATYRSQVNPAVLVFLVQVAGYKDTLLPEFYDRTYILGGWGPGLLPFAAAMAGLNAPPAVPGQAEAP